MQISNERFQEVMGVNFFAHVYLTKALLPYMIRRNEGHICTIASTGVLGGVPFMTDYSSSKFAAFGFHESLRLELRKMGKYGIKSTIVCPSHVDTQLSKHFQPPSFTRGLSAKYVGHNVVEAIQKDKRVVMLPRLTYVAYALRVSFQQPPKIA